MRTVRPAADLQPRCSRGCHPRAVRHLGHGAAAVLGLDGLGSDATAELRLRASVPGMGLN